MKTFLSPLTVRLGERDRAAIRAHFLALGPEDRRLRFGLALGDDSIGAYVDRIDFDRDAVLGVRGRGGRLHGVTHVAMTGEAAELGLSVLAAQRAHGIGGALFARSVAHLRNRGVRRVFVHCLAENAAMMHLARKSGMQIVNEGGEAQAHLVLDPPDADSLFREWLHEHQAAALARLRRHIRFVKSALATA
jgi:hypothetical protein